MAKFYTDKTPTPVFAVTFVSNRKGIIPSNKDTINKDGTVTPNKTNPNTQVEDITNDSYKFSSDIIKQGYLNKVNRIKTFKTTIVAQAKREKNQDYLSGTIYNGGLAVDDSSFFGYSLDSLRQELINYERENAAGYLPANTNISSPSNPVSSEIDTTKDSEYLIYSNLQIQKTDDPTDLSQQSNWFLREAEVELTRDWPIQKAKLIVACKLLDNGSVAPLVEIEKGFVWSKDKDNNFIEKLPTGRFLSADDEVRIYAGYKNDQCISMNDLDKYPFDFTNLETTGDIVASSADGLQLQQLQAEKKAIEDAISNLQNPLSDKVLWYSIAIGILSGVAAVAATGGTIGTSIFGGGTAISTTATTGTTVATTTATTGTTTTAVSTAADLAYTKAFDAAFTQAINQGLSRSAATQAATQAAQYATVPANTTVALTAAQQEAAVLARQIAATNTPATTIELAGAKSAAEILATKTYDAAFTQAINQGLSKSAATKAAYIAVAGLGVTTVASPALAGESVPAYKPTTRDYLDGRQSFNDNKALFYQLNLELAATTALIQVVQRKAGVAIKDYKSDPNKIAPIFWGFIDSVDFISNSNAGVQIIYNLRDRSRILADTKLVTLPFLGTDASNKNTFEGLKHKTIESVYRATNGGIYLDNSYKTASTISWRSGFEKGETINLYEEDLKDKTKPKTILEQRSALSQQRLKYVAAIEDPARWVIANAFLSSSDILKKDYNNFDPLFHTWTLQGPLVTGSGNNTMQIINKSPFEILSYLAITEVMPIDIFTSHINGHFMFAPRILDTSGLYDEQRGNRLYYFFDCFDKLPEQRSLIKDIRVQTSTIGVYNRFTVLTADFGSSTNASLSGLTSIVDIASANTKNRKVPVKQHVIVDPKVKQFEVNPQGAAQALALTTASSMARDNTTIIFKVIGDSSFYPGEAVRVFNTVLHSKGTFTFNATSTSTAVFLKSLYDEVEKIKATAVQQGGANNKVVDLSTVIDRMRKVAGQSSDDLNDALPMYKVRAITHSLKANGNDAGYTTKIVAIADIL
jgi:hypothetical protein